jgi:transglutaminase-like putative cysteine protease
MNARKAAPRVAAVLALIGLACVAVRYEHRRRASLEKVGSLWRVTYRARFQATRAGARLRLAIPADTTHARVFHEDVLYSGLAVQRLRSSRQLAREITLVTRRRGLHRLTARFDVHISPTAQWRGDADRVPDAQGRAELLRGTSVYPVDDPLVRATLEQVRRGLAGGAKATTDEVVQGLFDFCVGRIDDDDDGPPDALTALRRRTASPLGRARAMVVLCRAAGVPARLVTGFRIRQAAELPSRFWVEVLTGEQWTPFDPTTGAARVLPPDFVPVRRDGVEVVGGSDVAALETGVSVTRLPPGPGASRTAGGKLAAVFDLTRLPLETHNVLAVLLLMPLGALVTALFGTVIGVRTFGTFTPTLLALSFVYADPLTGLVTFVVVLALGLTTRKVLERLKLLMVPRLSVILTLVTLTIVFTVSVLDVFNLTPSAQAVILPLVILTMTVERFYLTSEEDSTAQAVYLMGTTLLVGLCCYAVLRWDAVGRVVLAYPEVHLFTVAVLVLLGRYSGYRLTELWRFRDLVGTEAAGREGTP